ncbi:acetyl-CoA synthetase-like protein [Aureobasidium pullulans]|uniref:Very long-chain fatty acid transport protein n=1 Tax=Aureobasidium pullulans TaxID=5580 RepID=A0A4S9AAS0_AURPU|nr:acetyl-CoA synthetase-like protein [Aureobasidium pullulans]THW76354.1 acetyl-CoA synthetase-like protein [Aureobasidium pullulans]
MAALPLTLAAPAAVASLAYLRAKTSFPNDYAILKATVLGALYVRNCVKNDRVNLFYELEKHALDPKTRDHSFLAIPPHIPKDVATPADLKGLQATEWSYKQVYETVLKFAAWLKQEHGVKKGDMVAIDYTNKTQFVCLWFALFSLGAKAAFINTNLRGKALLHCVKACKAKLLVVDPAIEDALTDEVRQELANSVQAVVLDDVTEGRIVATAGLRVPDEERGGDKISDTAVLIFTSGTTGLPKPAVVPWKKFLLSGRTVSNWLGVKSTDRYYTAMPLYHSSASILNISVVLHAGATTILSHHFSPKTFFASATASKATMMQYIGEMCRYLLSTPPSPFDKSHTIRMAFGNGLRPDVWQKFKERFNILEIAEFYSATEAVGGSFIKSKNNFGLGAVGRAGTTLQTLMGSQTAIVKHDVETGEPYRNSFNLCERVSPGESGEYINALDPNNISDKYVGYYGNQKASDSKILRDVFKAGDAWYRSGDLLRKDTQGRLFFVDRIGDTYRWKSENVSTNEVAEALSTSTHIEEINVYGVALPNHDGRAGCAAVMLKSAPSSQVLKEIAAHAREKLPKFAIPLFLRVVREFEVTGTAKYTKHGLREQGVDPGKVGEDGLLWLPVGADAYTEFGKRDWEGVVGGGVKL